MTALSEMIDSYHAALSPTDKAICDMLRKEIDTYLLNAASKLWHGHPVWFIDDNPIVGYAKRKESVQLLFWSGQSFQEPGLEIEGTFKASQKRYTSPDQIVVEDLRRWLAKSMTIQWDYKNIVKRRGALERLS